MASSANRRKFRACVIGASAGGVTALRTLLGGLSERFRPPVIVVLHTAADDHLGLCRMYGRVCPLPVVEAQERRRVEPRQVYMAPPGYHLLVEKNERFSLSADDKVRYVRPSIDVLFQSAADAWRNALVGVVLTGANDDGARGLKSVRERGGIGVVQSPSEAEVPDMPAAALRLAGADYAVKLEDIAPLLNRLAGVEA